MGTILEVFNWVRFILVTILHKKMGMGKWENGSEDCDSARICKRIEPRTLMGLVIDPSIEAATRAFIRMNHENIARNSAQGATLERVASIVKLYRIQ